MAYKNQYHAGTQGANLQSGNNPMAPPPPPGTGNSINFAIK